MRGPPASEAVIAHLELADRVAHDALLRGARSTSRRTGLSHRYGEIDRFRRAHWSATSEGCGNGSSSGMRKRRAVRETPRSRAADQTCRWPANRARSRARHFPMDGMRSALQRVSSNRSKTTLLLKMLRPEEQPLGPKNFVIGGHRFTGRSLSVAAASTGGRHAQRSASSRYRPCLYPCESDLGTPMSHRECFDSRQRRRRTVRPATAG